MSSQVAAAVGPSWGTIATTSGGGRPRSQRGIHQMVKLGVVSRIPREAVVPGRCRPGATLTRSGGPRALRVTIVVCIYEVA